MRSWLLQRAYTAFEFSRFVLRRWSHDRCPQIAGSLAFTTLLALVPTFAIAVAVLSRTPIFGELMVQLKIFLLLNLTPEIAGKIITVYMGEFAHNARRLTLIGIAILFVTAIALMLTIDRSLNTIWRSHKKRPFLVSVVAYLLLLVVGPILIGVSVSVTTYLMSLPERWSDLPAPAQPILLQGIPIAVSTITFYLIYRLVPHRKVARLHALAGGFVAGVLFECAKEGFGLYVAYGPMYSVVYGAFAAFPFFLLWIYLSWLIVLFGAELAAALDEWPPQAGTKFRGSRVGDVE